MSPEPAPGESRESVLSGGARRAAFRFIYITAALDMLALGVIIPVLPKLILEFQHGDTSAAARTIGVFGTTYAAMQFLFSPLLGVLSDRVGRKRIMLGGCALAALTYVPLYAAMKQLANPDLVPSVTTLSTGSAVGLIAIVWIQMIYVAMVYGPIAAFLVELFPTSIRYTSMSLPYHLGNGWFGGFLPLIATAATTSSWAKEFGTNAIYTGLIYPIVICVITIIVGGSLIRETKDHRIDTPVA